MKTNVVHTGDVFDVLPALPADSVHCVMTSPPYWNLRDYEHEDQIGLEDTLDDYIAEIVAVGDALRRVLRPDGSWWLNLGDTYENKQKLLVPHRVATALQDHDWIVRNDATWQKVAPMPESVTDRLATTTETVFHLTAQRDYWYDLDAIREPHATATHDRAQYGTRTADEWVAGQDGNHNASGHAGANPRGKNPGDVFEVATKPSPVPHFSAYPPELCETPLKATCPPHVCADCGDPYTRETETVYRNPENRTTNGPRYVDRGDESPNFDTRLDAIHYPGDWTQQCSCATDETQPGVVLDPFAGVGNTLLQAVDLNRRFVGVELRPKFADLARHRLGLPVRDQRHIREDDDQAPLDAFSGGDSA